MAEILVNVIGLLISAGLFFFSRDYVSMSRPGIPSAAFFPTIICVILLFLSVYNIIVYCIEKKKGNVDEPKTIEKAKAIQFLAVIVLLVLYAILWKYRIGHFILNTIVVFVPITWLLSDEVEWWKSAIYIVGLTVFIYLLFSIGLKVRIW